MRPHLHRLSALVIHAQQHLLALHCGLHDVDALRPDKQRQRPVLPPHKSRVALALQRLRLRVERVREAPAQAVERGRARDARPALVHRRLVVQREALAIEGLRLNVEDALEVGEEDVTMGALHHRQLPHLRAARARVLPPHGQHHERNACRVLGRCAWRLAKCAVCRDQK